MHRSAYYVIDPLRRRGAAVLRLRWEWAARLAARLTGLDYAQPGESLLTTAPPNHQHRRI